MLMPCWFAIFVNAFCNEVVAICYENVLYLGGKNFHSSLKVWKKHSLLIDFSKFLKLMHFFGNYANYVLRAKLCDSASKHDSGSPALMSIFFMWLIQTG